MYVKSHYFSLCAVIDIFMFVNGNFVQKMVAIPTTKVANILNTFTFTKDKIVVLELIAL